MISSIAKGTNHYLNSSCRGDFLNVQYSFYLNHFTERYFLSLPILESKDFLFDCRRFFDSTLSNTCIANTVTDTYINLMIKTERTNWFYDIQEVHFVKTFINCISKTKTLRRNFISIIFNSNDVWIQKKTNYDKKIDYTSSYKKSLKKIIFCTTIRQIGINWISETLLPSGNA